MINTIYSSPDDSFSWIDVINPSREELSEIARDYNLHPAAVKDCMAPMHLPKCEMINEVIFMVTRVYDQTARVDADTIQQLTNKVALFISKTFIITVHRKDEPFLTHIRKRWITNRDLDNRTVEHLFNDLLDKVIHSFDPALQNTTEYLDDLEKKVFEGSKDPKIIRNMYVVKRRASVFKRVIFLTKDTIEKYTRLVEKSPFTSDLVDSANSLFFLADELQENTNNLLNLHISLASHKTNEVMGVLTIFSVFFLPLTFIVGLYGMNFKEMPELGMKYGYVVVWVVMILSTVITYVWFKKRGWL